jgi:hypothetical protein
MRPVVVTVGRLVAANTSNIATSQTPSAAGSLTLNGTLVSGGVATMDTPRRVLITTAAAISFTITGTDWAGSPISETVTNSGASVASVLSYLTVTNITNSATAGGNAITVGTNGVADSPWVRFDNYSFGAASIQANVSGTANYTLYFSNDDPNSATNPVNPNAMTWSTGLSPMVASAATAQGVMSTPFLWAKVTLNSGTGSVATTFVQFSNAPL